MNQEINTGDKSSLSYPTGRTRTVENGRDFNFVPSELVVRSGLISGLVLLGIRTLLFAYKIERLMTRPDLEQPITK